MKYQVAIKSHVVDIALMLSRKMYTTYQREKIG